MSVTDLSSKIENELLKEWQNCYRNIFNLRKKIKIVNIQNLVETLNADLTEGSTDDDRALNLKDQLTKVLVDVTTDFQLGITQ